MATCTVQNHPSCTITCPRGCMALFREPNGPCFTRCTSRASAERISLEDGDEVSLHISDFPAAELAEILGVAAARGSEARINLSRERMSWKDVLQEIERQLA